MAMRRVTFCFGVLGQVNGLLGVPLWISLCSPRFMYGFPCLNGVLIPKMSGYSDEDCPQTNWCTGDLRRASGVCRFVVILCLGFLMKPDNKLLRALPIAGFFLYILEVFPRELKMPYSALKVHTVS